MPILSSRRNILLNNSFAFSFKIKGPNAKLDSIIPFNNWIAEQKVTWQDIKKYVILFTDYLSRLRQLSRFQIIYFFASNCLGTLSKGQVRRLW